MLLMMGDYVVSYKNMAHESGDLNESISYEL